MKKNQTGTYFLLRWGVIVAAMVLVWPLGVILLVTKLIGVARQNREEKLLTDQDMPYAAWKTAADRQGYGQMRSKEKKLFVTALLATALFLLLGCGGVTNDYMRAFAQGLDGGLVRDFASHAAFLLLGLYMGKCSHAILQQRRRWRRLHSAMGDRAQVPLQELAEATGCAQQQVIEDVQAMAERFWFGHGAYYDAASQVLHCRTGE